jgi:hypothetical protein
LVAGTILCTPAGKGCYAAFAEISHGRLKNPVALRGSTVPVSDERLWSKTDQMNQVHA